MILDLGRLLVYFLLWILGSFGVDGERLGLGVVVLVEIVGFGVGRF